MSEIEIRAAQVADVSYPSRTVTVLVAPYDTPTVIHTSRGQFTEVVTRGAYDGVQRRAGSVRANRDHDWQRMAGRVTALHPERDEGLVAEVRMFKTVLGEETLELCADDGLSASAGFALMRTEGASGSVKPQAEVWEGRTRRLNELWLDHVAFVPNPAYETATVLDVRDAAELVTVGRPNLERLQLELARARLAEIDARYGLAR
jgi:HK97 family phage prohead protease